ncbi:MAG: hypothetical protein WC563_15310 [Brevundimonas sp.]
MLDLLLRAAEQYGTTPQAIRSRLRFARVKAARLDVWRQLHRVGWTWARIAEAFGRDESSVRQTVRADDGLYRKSRVA